MPTSRHANTQTQTHTHTDTQTDTHTHTHRHTHILPSAPFRFLGAKNAASGRLEDILDVLKLPAGAVLIVMSEMKWQRLSSGKEKQNQNQLRGRNAKGNNVRTNQVSDQHKPEKQRQQK